MLPGQMTKVHSSVNLRVGTSGRESGYESEAELVSPYGNFKPRPREFMKFEATLGGAICDWTFKLQSRWVEHLFKLISK